MATATIPAAAVPTDATRLAAVRALARLMDSAVEVPGLKIKLGLDSVIGLFPGVGDVVTSAIGGYIVMIASQMGVPRTVVWRMLMNLGIDTVVGAVPFVGDLFDVAWKANTKNVKLLEQALADPKGARRSGIWMIVGIVAVVTLLAAGAATGTWFLLNYLLR